MKNRLFAAMAVLFLLCGGATAQNYHIRTNARINLRAVPSLEGRRLETVSSGTVLLVAGERGKWLKINRNETLVWMANWVNYTRVSNSEQTQSPSQTSRIDNCCFVDRQCGADAEWTSGYWAYQNNQCSAPGQSQPEAASSPVSDVPAQTDNCCFVDRVCHTDQQWTDGYWAYQNNQCAAPGTQATGIAIEGSPNFRARVQEALDLLKKIAPQWYDYTDQGLAKIREVSQAAGSWGVWVGDRRFDINLSDSHLAGGSGSDRLNLASAIVHDACHVHQKDAGKQLSSAYEVEKECLIVQIKATNTFAPNSGLVAYLRDILINIDKPEYQWWN